MDAIKLTPLYGEKNSKILSWKSYLFKKVRLGFSLNRVLFFSLLHTNKSTKGRLDQAVLQMGLDVNRHFLLDCTAYSLIQFVSN